MADKRGTGGSPVLAAGEPPAPLFFVSAVNFER